MPADINLLASGVLVTTMCSLLISTLASKTNTKLRKEENEEIEVSLNNIANLSKDEKENVIDLMLMNIKELKEYYVISKIQARKSFVASLSICFLGIVIYILGMLAITLYNTDITILTLISGTIVELFAGSFFWLHNKSTKQLNLYHRRLSYTEKYLTVIQIINTMSENKRDEEYRNLINFILSDNSKAINNEILNNEGANI